MANKIDKQIEQLAEQMTKSVTEGKQTLFDTIMNLGPDGLKKALPSLTPAQQELVKQAVEEMNKATHMPTETDDAKKLAPEKTSTKHGKMKQESNTGSDDQDEKLMEDKNKDHKAQGGPSDKPEGWEGQVIKAKEPPHKGPNGGTIIGHTKDGKPIYEHAGHAAHKEFEPHHHEDASEAHLRISDKHHEDKMKSPYASVAGLQSIAGDKKKFEEAKEQHSKDSGEHILHRESAAYHRRMADAKRNIPSDSGEMTPADHQAQADRHMDRVNKLHELRKCGYLMKDMGQGGAGDYGLAMSMNKSDKELDAEINKAYENFMTKASDKIEKKQGVPEGVDPEKWERGVKEVKKDPKVDNPYAVVNAAMAKGEEMENKEQMDSKQDEAKLSPEQKLEKKKMKKAKKIAKSIKKIVKLAKSLGMSKEDVKKAIEAAGGDLKIVKSEMKAKINKEEDQVKIETQDESAVSAPKPDQSKGDLEIKPDETADEALKKLPKVEKAMAPWKMKSSIAAGSLGRNTHWDVDAYIEKSEAEKQDIIKKGGYFGEKEVEDLKKSQEAKKADINDMIEKGMDYSSDEISRIQSNQNHKPDDGAVRKSNYDVEIARSMGMSEDEYKKIFGSND